MNERKKTRKRHMDFFESMPGTYTQPYDVFTRNEVVENQPEEQAEDVVRSRMVRQLAVLVGLLVLQFILFAILLKSTVNLG